MSFLRTLRRVAVGATATALCTTGLVAGQASAETPGEIPVPNSSFEQWTDPASWVASDWAMTSTVWVTDAAAHTGSYSQTLSQWNGATTLSQTVTAPEGSYDVSLFVWANEGLGSSALIANGVSTPIVSGGATQIDGALTWDEIKVRDVPVGPDGALEIQIVLDAFTSATLSGFIDDVTVVPAAGTPGGDEPAPEDSLLLDSGFEDSSAAWSTTGAVVDSGRGGSAHAVLHDQVGIQETVQAVEGLADGYYRLTAWVRNDGGFEEAYLVASGGGDSEAMAAIPRTNFPYDAPDTWKRVTLRGVHVTSGRLEVGLRTSGTAAGSVLIDDVALVQDSEPYDLLIGGDISMVTYTEDLGGRYFDEAGVERDPLEILADNGWNIVRIRAYNDPGKGRGTDDYYVPAGYVDAEDALALAQRAKAAGLQIQLSFHYSDYWTNPGTQMIPHAWQTAIEGMSDSDAVATLENEVYTYTKDLMDRMIAQGTTPDYVSLGNETRSGMLFPYGTIGNWDNLARFYNAGAAAVRETAPEAGIIIHLDDGGNTSTYQTYFGNAESRNVDYDIIGTSYYPFWTNKTSASFAEFATTISQQFGKPLMIMETGFNYQADTGAGTIGQLNNNGPYGDASSSTPVLQRDFMIELFNEMQGVPDGMVIGDLYWDPIFLYAGGQTGWAYFESTDEADINVVDNTTLFDLDGRALPVLDAYRLNTRGVETGTAAGKVLDAAGQPVISATVTLTQADGTQRTVMTNRYGDYYFSLTVPGDHTVVAEKAELGVSETSTSSVVAASRTDVDLRLPGAQTLHTISGVVTDESGTPVANVSVRVEGGDVATTVLTAADGSYVIADVADGSLTMTVVKDGYVVPALPIVVAGADVTHDIALAANVGDVTGRVVGPDGLPVVDATIVIGDLRVMTGPDGVYTVTSVPAGSGLVVQASKSGYIDVFSEALTISQGITTPVSDLVLPLEIAVTNGSFETAGEGGESTAAGWVFTEEPVGAVVRQNRDSFGGTTDGTYAASFWAEPAFTAQAEQSIVAESPGLYSVSAYLYSGVTGTMTMYLKDATGQIIAETPVAPNSGAEHYELTAEIADPTFTVGFLVNGNAGDWSVVDSVTAGYLGAAPEPEPSPSPTPSPTPAPDTESTTEPDSTAIPDPATSPDPAGNTTSPLQTPAPLPEQATSAPGEVSGKLPSTGAATSAFLFGASLLLLGCGVALLGFNRRRLS
ncbi:MAG: glycosyl hydrolase 53 family protein [Propionibacteriaceae bacterium]|jgi:arabinogalactan endo-1,4-beta-galactosidase|nr:glycosyl hydrolase 53 family protein [Propionibacteriaceae bacterium]